MSVVGDNAGYSEFHMYRRGWIDGASGKAMDPNRWKPKTKAAQEAEPNPALVAEYEKGYTDGYTARKEGLQKAAESYGYNPSVLRTSTGQFKSLGTETGRFSCSAPNIANKPGHDS